MRQLLPALRFWVWLVMCASLAAHAAHAQSANYPPPDEEWDGASYRALIERVEDRGLALPTLSDAATKPVFERMVNLDNIPLRMGLNRDLNVTIRFQKLESSRPPILKLIGMYLNETKKGKPYASEHARLMIYGAKVSAAVLDLSERYLSTLKTDTRYLVHVAHHDKVRTGARQLYADLVQGMTETKLYSKSDVLNMIKVAVDGLPSYLPILTDQDRQALTQKLSQQIAATTDQPLKTALTELRDMIQHRRIRT